MLEPIVQTEVVSKVRPRIARGKMASSTDSSERMHPIESKKKRSSSVHKLSPIRVGALKMPSSQQMAKPLSPRMRQSCEKVIKRRPDLESQVIIECGHVVSDMISDITRPLISTAASSGSHLNSARPPKPRGPPRNRVQAAKQEQEQQKLLEQQKRDAQIKKRQLELKRHLSEQRALKEKEEQEKLENQDELAQAEAEVKKKLEAAIKKQQ